MTKVVDGAALASCFKVVSSCGSEIDKMSDSLLNLLTDAFSEDDDKLKPLLCALNGKHFSSYCMDDFGWVCTDIAYNLPLKKVGRSKQTLAYLGFQISMTGTGIAAPGNNEPLVHVFLWKEPVDFVNDNMGFPLEEDSNLCVCDEVLIKWGSWEKGQWSDRLWLFSLRLTTLNSSEDLKRCIVEPALALLCGESVLSALPSSIEGLIRYTDKQQLFAEVKN